MTVSIMGKYLLKALVMIQLSTKQGEHPYSQTKNNDDDPGKGASGLKLPGFSESLENEHEYPEEPSEKG
jgi:hypothetical protein